MRRIILGMLVLACVPVSTTAVAQEITAYAVVTIPEQHVSDPGDPESVPTPEITPGDDPETPIDHVDVFHALDCRDSLLEFISNPEFVGPLVDYLTCTGDTYSGPAVVPLVLSTVDQIPNVIPSVDTDVLDYVGDLYSFLVEFAQSGGVDYATTTTNENRRRILVGECRFTPKFERVGRTVNNAHYNFEEIRGVTKCIARHPSHSNANYTVDGQAHLIDGISGETRWSAPYFSARAEGDSTYNSIGTGVIPSYNDQDKIKFFSGAAVDNHVVDQLCSVAGPGCRMDWVVVANKNASSAPRLACSVSSSPFSKASTLECEVDSLAYQFSGEGGALN